jgi:acetyl esterase/lipase
MKSEAIALGVLFAIGLGSAAQTATPAATIRLYPGAAPGSEHAVQQESVLPAPDGKRVLHNVTQPTLTVFSPPAGCANRAAVIIAPGGAFQILSVDNEGTAVAEWLAARGMTAFVLKYRLNATPANALGVMAAVGGVLKATRAAPDGLPPPTLGETQAAADAAQAIGLVRSRAAEWNLDPTRLGMMGFSAGAIVATTVATAADPATRPDFLVSIYGGLRASSVPHDAPPLFAAAASDDTLLPGRSLPLYTAWMKAGRPAELHLYERGGHGFGMTKKDATSDRWIDEFGWWLEANKLLVPQGKLGACHAAS